MKYHFLSLLLIFQFLDLSEEKKGVRMVIEKMSFLISVSQGHFERFVHSNHAAYKSNDSGSVYENFHACWKMTIIQHFIFEYFYLIFVGAQPLFEHQC